MDLMQIYLIFMNPEKRNIENQNVIYKVSELDFILYQKNKK